MFIFLSRENNKWQVVKGTNYRRFLRRKTKKQKEKQQQKCYASMEVSQTPTQQEKLFFSGITFVN